MLPCCCWPLLFFSCSVLRFSLALSGFFFWVFVALKWVWIPCCMSQIIVSEMGSSLLNLMLFFLLCSLEKKCYKKKFLAGQHINSALYLYVLSYALIIVYCCKWMFVGFRQNKLATWCERAMKVSCCSKLFVLVSRYMTIKSDRQRGL